MNSVFRLLIIGSVAFTVLLQSAHAGSFKKWVDENGVTHYGTSIPPQYRDRAHSELNQQGIEVKKHDRAKTQEELEHEKALAALRAEQKKLLEEQQARDRILLNLYRNEDDLVMARDGKIAQLDGQIRLTHKDIQRLKNRLSEFQITAAAAERGGKRLTGKQLANLQSTQRSIEKSYAVILGKEDEKRATMERYNYDLARFRELRKGGARAANADVVTKSDIPDLVDTAVRCQGAECDRLWETAKQYARRHTTTPVDLTADRILVTAPARELKDISVTVSRLDNREGGGERIFMDVQCVALSQGREFCRSSEVEAIRDGFRTALGHRVADQGKAD
jgi:hypothetical protein